MANPWKNRQNPISKIKIEILDLSVRASNCLKRANIYTIGDLTERTEDDLSKIHSLGKKSVDEIIEKLEMHNYYLKSSNEE